MHKMNGVFTSYSLKFLRLFMVTHNNIPSWYLFKVVGDLTVFASIRISINQTFMSPAKQPACVG